MVCVCAAGGVVGSGIAAVAGDRCSPRQPFISSEMFWWPCIVVGFPQPAASDAVQPRGRRRRRRTSSSSSTESHIRKVTEGRRRTSRMANTEDIGHSMHVGRSRWGSSAPLFPAGGWEFSRPGPVRSSQGPRTVPAVGGPSHLAGTVRGPCGAPISRQAWDFQRSPRGNADLAFEAVPRRACLVPRT